VELQRNLNAVRQQGLGLAAISYDSVAVLKDFTDRQHITFPLLSDPESKIIRAFDILNETVAPGTAFYGIPNPGTYVIDPQGRVVSKYFEDDYRERVSATDILIQDFGNPAAEARKVAETKHLRIITTASTLVARPGHRVVLSLEINLKPKMHVYAPGVQGYIPIEWKLEDSAAGKLQPATYPASEMLHLEAIGETVPVYRGRVIIKREITFGQEAALTPLVNPAGELMLKGSFRYQACDDRVCYVPQIVPLEWRFHFERLERARVPADLQRKLP
jgi:hypothetical protein